MKFPFCPQCGAVRPDGDASSFCVPCMNRGHNYRLVTDKQDAARRVKLWTRYYDSQGFTPEQRASITSFGRLQEAC